MIVITAEPIPARRLTCCRCVPGTPTADAEGDG